MIRHLLKLVWRRKRSTSLLMLEIAASFLVVFAVGVLSLRLLHNWRQPLGYRWQDLWMVDVAMEERGDDTWNQAETQRVMRLIGEAGKLSRVRSAAGIQVAPYEMGGWSSSVRYQQRNPISMLGQTTDDFRDTVGLHLVAGRWFGREDDGASELPVVLNRRLARALFDGEDPLGKVLQRGDNRERVVGVVDDYRQWGELASPGNYLFERTVPTNPHSRPPRRLLLRMAAGTPATYEQEILRRLAPVAPGWSLTVKPLAALRHDRLRFELAPLIVGAVVAVFLLLMVALGLLGVLWQNVTRRTRELGLRRAAGASRAAVHRQVLLELLLTTTLAVVPALVLVLQLPLIVSLEAGVVAGAVVLALLTVYILSVACGLYPSRIATRLPPAEALRWE